VTIVDSVRTHGATHLGLHATDLIPAIRHYASGSDDGSELANLIFSKNWTILGRAADDILQWDGATVDIFAGNDTFKGGGGNDVIELYKGNDHGIGGDGFDALIGDGGNDKLEGGAQKDDLMGGTGRDILLGGSGADRLDGGPGSDKLVGGGGNDRMIGGAGNDRMNGGHGHDVFFFDTGSGHDRITHFDVNHDVIKLTGGDHGVKIVNIAHGVRVVHDGGMIDLIGVHHGALHHGDILGW
jgi:Ca2+-binding RTX toxin-like protein